MGFFISKLGIIFYSVLTAIAIAIYPGGNKFDRQYSGFSFYNNFWCDLFSEIAYNGSKNPGRPYAILGNYLLMFSLFAFWISISKFFQKEKKLAASVRTLGPAAMVATLLISTRFHDWGIHTAVPLGMLAFLLTLLGLWKCREKLLAYLGMTAAAIISFNYLSLVFRTFPQHLAFIQKIALFSFFSWVLACLVKLKPGRSLIQRSLPK